VELTTRELRIYRTADGRLPFEEWLASLHDERALARILVRLDRVRFGNFGDCRSVGGGVQELRIDSGPGYRVYFGRQGSTIVLLLCGGDKSSRAKDINLAHDYWNEYGRRP
jgi:putative addiction module killer protein